ncbi:hypothetical protein Pan97_11770 [Bremerella volcania]|uniref:Rhamnogalacturonan lyase domain-containing protein n=1 Tax=Bremerella volcania TaxID=2527984 RepID=A0A518C4L1_9BACT|nr:carboxypeptidase regulatory-like domain-containing protein [Bremerella volcania]QDU74172.1 hypothetical protein Pan97_11770 [Bremerella volcania]
MRLTNILMLTLIVLGIFAQDLFAQQWGTITGRFVVKGVAAKPPAMNMPAAVAGVCPGPLANPQLRVGPKNELQDVAVWLYLDRGEDAPEPHPMYAPLRNMPVQISNKVCLYEPHVATIQPGQTVQFVNADPIPHNFKVEGFANAGINFLVPVNGMQPHIFQAEERYPMNASCAIHPWMNAKIVIRESPYMAVSDKNGKFTIENLPVGTHKFQIWHEIPGNIKEVTLGGKVLKDRKGVVEIEVKPGQNDLGDIVIDAGLLK